MAPKKASSLPSPIRIGNCEVVVEVKNYTAKSIQNSLQISLSRNVKIKKSVLEDMPRKDFSDLQHSNSDENGNCEFVLVNPKDVDGQSKALLQEVLTMYMKELPTMNYAANTGRNQCSSKNACQTGNIARYC